MEAANQEILSAGDALLRKLDAPNSPANLALVAAADRLAAERPMRLALCIADNFKGDFQRPGDDIASDFLRELAELPTRTDKGVEAERLVARAEQIRQQPQWIVTGFVFVTP